MTSAPARAAASPTLVLKKQLSGLLIGLSQTITLRAPAPRQSFTTADTVSGWVVAARSGFLSKATFGLITTTSPFLMKRLTPPIALRADSTISRACSSRACNSSSLVEKLEGSGGADRTTTTVGKLGDRSTA